MKTLLHLDSSPLSTSITREMTREFVKAWKGNHPDGRVFYRDIAQDGGALLLENRFVSLALVLLGPVIINIVLFHSTMAPEGLPLALFTTVLWAVVFYSVREVFKGFFQMRVQPYENRN